LSADVYLYLLLWGAALQPELKARIQAWVKETMARRREEKRAAAGGAGQ
jgi:glutathione S-transferase